MVNNTFKLKSLLNNQMENINKNDDEIPDYSFENIHTVERDQEFNLDWLGNEDDETEQYIYEVKILFIGNTLSGKSFIISKLIDEFHTKADNFKVNPVSYKRTIGLDKRLHEININKEIFIIKYYELASNLDFSRLNDNYIDFLNIFDLLFFVFNKELNFEENLIFLDNFKYSIADSYLTNEQNAKYLFEKKLYLINSTLKYDDNDKLKHINSIRENKLRLSKYTTIDKSRLLNNKDFMLFENNSEFTSEFKTKDLKGKLTNNDIKKEKQNNNSKYLINQISFHVNNFCQFKTEFCDLVYSLFYRKDTLKISSKTNNDKESNGFLKNLTIVKKKDKDMFDFVSKFLFERHRKRIKKKIHC